MNLGFNGYALFCKANRHEFVGAHGRKAFATVSKKMAKRWHNLTQQEKLVWKNKALEQQICRETESRPRKELSIVSDLPRLRSEAAASSPVTGTIPDQINNGVRLEDMRKSSEGMMERPEDMIERSEGMTRSEDMTKRSEDMMKRSEGMMKRSEGIMEPSEAMMKRSEDLTKRSEDMTKRSEGMTERSEDMDSPEEMRYLTEKMRHETEDERTRDRNMPVTEESFEEWRTVLVWRGQKRPRRCGDCKACNRTDDCRKCKYCLDMWKYGGPNVKKQKCIKRKCHNYKKNKMSDEKSSMDKTAEEEYSNDKMSDEDYSEDISEDIGRKRTENIGRQRIKEIARKRTQDILNSYEAVRNRSEDKKVSEEMRHRLDEIKKSSKDSKSQTEDSVIICRNIKKREAVKVFKKEKIYRRSVDCGKCAGCLRETNCRICEHCRDMKKYGGPNTIKQKCRQRQCQSWKYMHGRRTRQLRNVENPDPQERIMPGYDCLIAIPNIGKSLTKWMKQRNISMTRCNNCLGCDRKYVCGRCDFCQEKHEYGGAQRLRQKCRFKQCLKLGIPDCVTPRLVDETVIWDAAGFSFDQNVLGHYYYDKKEKNNKEMEQNDIQKRKLQTVSGTSAGQQIESPKKKPNFKVEIDDDEFEIEIVGDSDMDYLEMPEPQPKDSSNDNENVGDTDMEHLEMPEPQPKDSSNDNENVGDTDMEHLEMPEPQPKDSSNDNENVGDTDMEHLEMPEPQPKDSSNDTETFRDTDMDYLEMPDPLPQNSSNDSETVGDTDMEYLEMPELSPQNSSVDSDLSRDTLVPETSKDNTKVKSEVDKNKNDVLSLQRISESVNDDSSAVHV